MDKDEFRNSTLGDLLDDLPDAVPGINETPELHKVRVESSINNRIKEIFDQNGVLNPDIKLGASSKFTLTHFRTTSLPKIMI